MRAQDSVYGHRTWLCWVKTGTLAGILETDAGTFQHRHVGQTTVQ